MKYVNKQLSEEIELLKRKRKEIVDELRKIDNELVVKEKNYRDATISFNKSKNICSCCLELLDNYEIKEDMIYCEECKMSNSCLHEPE